VPAAKTYVVVHDVSLVVDDDTGREKTFKPGDVYDGPTKHIPTLLAGVDFHGPLIAEKPAQTAADTTNKE
jgi:hypothetical protein